ncbi:MAG TPA: MCE family protein [Phycisphaerales bacterium]|nr:MCE family protein [Phycisphaerales bacterium]
MNPRLRDILIGLTSITGLILLAWMLMSFGELSGIGQTYQRIVIRTPSAKGVSPVSPVSLNGVRIGDVTSIGLDQNGTGEALIHIRYDEDVRIPTDFRVYLNSGLIGTSSLDLQMPIDSDGAIVPGQGEEYARTIRTLFDDLSEQFADRLDRLDETTDHINKLAITYTDVGERLAGIIDSDEPGVDDLRSTLARLDSVLTDAEAWMAEDGLLADIKQTVTTWDETATEIQTQSTAVSRRTQESLAQLDNAVISLNDAITEAKDITARINRGEGTLGQLSTNADLYRSLDATIMQLQELIKEGRLLIEKFKDEGVPINL